MLTFDQERHIYRLDGKIVPSVTQITGPLSDFSGIPADVLERKRQIGTALHKCIELHLVDNLDESTIDPAVKPYFSGFHKFLFETGFVVRFNEKRVASKQYGFAGTLDLDGYLKGRLGLLDFKTTATLSPAVAIQTSGYMQASNEEDPDCKILDRYALHLKPDGTYRLQQYADRMDWHIFNSLLNIHKWRMKNANA